MSKRKSRKEREDEILKAAHSYMETLQQWAHNQLVAEWLRKGGKLLKKRTRSKAPE